MHWKTRYQTPYSLNLFHSVKNERSPIFYLSSSIHRQRRHLQWPFQQLLKSCWALKKIHPLNKTFVFKQNPPIVVSIYTQAYEESRSSLRTKKKENVTWTNCMWTKTSIKPIIYHISYGITRDKQGKYYTERKRGGTVPPSL